MLLVLPYFKGKNKGGKITTTELFYVKLKTLADTIILQNHVKQNNLIIVEQNQYMPLWFTIACTESANENSLLVANKFYESNNYAAAEPDFLMDKSLTNDPYFSQQWGLSNQDYGVDIKAIKAWEITKGKGINVAVIDQGIQLNHPDLANNIYPRSYDSETNREGSVIRENHGTAVAGIIAAIENNLGGVGVAPEAKLISISNSLSTGSLASLANGLNWAWKNGADIINNSWKLTGGSDIIADAIRNCVKNGRAGKGCVVTFGSGNDVKSSVAFPAEMTEVIAVGAIDNSGDRAAYSNYGNELDVVAPGGHDIVTTDLTGSAGHTPDDYYMSFSGTSAATPFVVRCSCINFIN